MSKKYFWLKLKDDFFRDKRIKKLRRVAGGDTYTVIYLKMQLLSLKNEGVLFYEGIEDTFYEELALEIDESEENVQFTIMFLQQNGLLDEVNENEFALIETMNSIGSETQAAERVRRHRQIKTEKKALQCNTSVTTSNTEIEKEKELEKELEKEKTYVQQVELLPSNEIDLTEIHFKKFWDTYNKKQDIAKARKSFSKVIKKHDINTIIEHTLKYMDFLKVKDGNLKFQKMASTFLNNFDLEDDFLVKEELNNGQDTKKSYSKQVDNKWGL